MTYMEMHHAVINEVLKGTNGENLKTLITTDFTNVCNINVNEMLPNAETDDVEIINNVIKNIIIYEAIKTDTLGELLNNVTDVIKHELYLLANDNKISTNSIDTIICDSNVINIVNTYNKTKAIMLDYNIIQSKYKIIVPIDNMYNHKLNRHFITMGVYVGV